MPDDNAALIQQQILAAQQANAAYMAANQAGVPIPQGMSAATYLAMGPSNVQAQQYAAANSLNGINPAALQNVPLSQIAAQYASLVQTLSAENASLNASMAQRQATQKTQVNVDTNLPMVGVSARWSVLLPTVTPSAPLTGGISLTETQAHDTLAYMEQVPVLQADLQDETKVAANYLQEVQKSDLLNADLNSQILGLKKENTDLVAKDVADVKACKAQERKSKITWIKRALAIGFGLGLYAGAHGF